jgi:hypothetical protein
MKFNTSRLVNATVLFFLASYLTACSSQSMQLSGTSSSALKIAADSSLLKEVSEILTGNSGDVSFLIPSGPRQGKKLTAGKTYFAASGRFCRKILIRDDFSQERYVACNAEPARWELIPVAM